MTGASDYFGSDAQQALLRRGRAMYDVVRDDPRLTYYGRTVGVASADVGSLDKLADLAHLQGNSNISDVPGDQIEALAAEATARGLSPVTYARWEGGSESVAKARAFLEANALPDGLTTHWLTPDTPPDLLASFAQTALGCGVLPPTTAALTGALRPGMCLIAHDAAGNVASCAGSVAHLHAADPAGTTLAWWGMLATRPDHRGARLSLILGAMVMIRMHEKLGFTRFFTGVEPGNAPSEAVCKRLGLAPDGAWILGAADPGLVPGGRMTK